MPTYSFKRAPSAVTSDYKLIADGDKYIFARGSTVDYYNMSAACVVNYGVAQNILSSSTSWSGISEATFEAQKGSILESLTNTTPATIYGKKVTYYLFGGTYFAVRLDTTSDPPVSFSESVNYNEKKLEFNVLRNNSLPYVAALDYFLNVNGASVIGVEEYESARNKALEAIKTEGGDVVPLPPIGLG